MVPFRKEVPFISTALGSSEEVSILLLPYLDNWLAGVTHGTIYYIKKMLMKQCVANILYYVYPCLWFYIFYCNVNVIPPVC